MRDYQPVAAQMLAYTDQRGANSPDEIWLLEHFPVFTQGTSCRSQPRQNPNNIPVVRSSRGGQITYHGPGQLIAYLLLDIKRAGLGPKSLVAKVEQAVIQLLNDYGLAAERQLGAPGGIYCRGENCCLGVAHTERQVFPWIKR